MEVEVCFLRGVHLCMVCWFAWEWKETWSFFIYSFLSATRRQYLKNAKWWGRSFVLGYSFIWSKSKWVQIVFRLSWFGPPVWLAFYPIPFRFLSGIIILLHPHFSLLHVDLYSTFVNSFYTFEFYFSFYVSLHFCTLIQLLFTNLFVYVKYRK